MLWPQTITLINYVEGRFDFGIQFLRPAALSHRRRQLYGAPGLARLRRCELPLGLGAVVLMSSLSLVPVSAAFLMLQKPIVEGIAASGPTR